MELKFSIQGARNPLRCCSNRTFMELKLHTELIEESRIRSNRTFMELKWYSSDGADGEALF